MNKWRWLEWEREMDDVISIVSSNAWGSSRHNDFDIDKMGFVHTAPTFHTTYQRTRLIGDSSLGHCFINGLEH
ncbi:hypothetical protein CR513_07130, partial [Mucuna pruriens]